MKKFFDKPIDRDALLYDILGFDWRLIFPKAKFEKQKVEIKGGSERYFSGTLLVEIKSKEEVASENSKRPHRVFVECPCCFRMIPVGRVMQHDCESKWFKPNK